MRGVPRDPPPGVGEGERRVADVAAARLLLSVLESEGEFVPEWVRHLAADVDPPQDDYIGLRRGPETGGIDLPGTHADLTPRNVVVMPDAHRSYSLAASRFRHEHLETTRLARRRTVEQSTADLTSHDHRGADDQVYWNGISWQVERPNESAPIAYLGGAPVIIDLTESAPTRLT